jgi:hypothetical protein
MKRVLLLVAAFGLGTLALPAHAATSTTATASLCAKKHHKKKRHGKKKASAAPTRSPSSNI